MNFPKEVLPKLKSAGLDQTVESLWIGGGTAVYKHAMDSLAATHIYLTKIHKDFDCDTFFPEIDSKNYVEVVDPAVDQDLQTEGGLTYNFHVYERVDSKTLERKAT